jgi:DNA-binding response OmpR family regulator
MKILIVEDNALLGKSLKRGMEEHGWTVDLATDGDEGLYMVESTEHDVIVLDWMLPKTSGIDLLKEIRKRGRDTPTVMITARGAVPDRVEGLNLGADDYVVKPFEVVELIARINAVYRRSLGKGTSLLTIGSLTLNLASHTAQLRGVSMDLTSKEYDLVAALATKAGDLVKRNSLVGMLYPLESEPDSNSLDVLLARVRKKLQGSGVEIETVRGKGFVLRVAEATP